MVGFTHWNVSSMRVCTGAPSLAPGMMLKKFIHSVNAY